MNVIKFEMINGMTLRSITNTTDEILMTLTDEAGNTRIFKMYHDQDCCESVNIESITGAPLTDHIGHRINHAECSESKEPIEGAMPEYIDSFTWSFYKIGSMGGWTDIRWYGESNGYYSESVDFLEIKNKEIKL